jgi:hypothetical protein
MGASRSLDGAWVGTVEVLERIQRRTSSWKAGITGPLYLAMSAPSDTFGLLYEVSIDKVV